MSNWETNTSPDEIAAFLKDKERIAVLTHARRRRRRGLIARARPALNKASKTRAPWRGTSGRAQLARPTRGRRRTMFSRAESSRTSSPMPSSSWTPAHGASSTRWPIGAPAARHHQRDRPPSPATRTSLHIAKTCAPPLSLCAGSRSVSRAQANSPLRSPSLIYTGPATDTGWFRHSNVKPRSSIWLGSSSARAWTTPS